MLISVLLQASQTGGYYSTRLILLYRILSIYLIKLLDLLLFSLEEDAEGLGSNKCYSCHWQPG